MNQQLADSVKDLAKPVVEAIKVIVGSVKCPLCKGEGEVGALIGHTIRANKKIADGIYCEVCSGTGKVKWKWEPKVGEWFIHNDGSIKHLHIIGVVEQDEILFIDQLSFSDKTVINKVWPEFIKRNIMWPVLEWEEIERVLEGMGYRLYVTQHGCSILRYNLETKLDIGSTPLAKALGGCRQEAVMRAVIKLGEEKHD